MLRPFFYSVSFDQDEGEMHIEQETGDIVTEDVGKLVVAFLDIDWKSWMMKVEEVKNLCKDRAGAMAAFREFFRSFLEELRVRHSLLNQLVTIQLRKDIEDLLTGSAWIKIDVKYKGDSVAEYAKLLLDWTKDDVFPDDGCINRVMDKIEAYIVKMSETAEIASHFVENVLDPDGGELLGRRILDKYTWFRGCDEDYMTHWPDAYKRLSPEMHVELKNRVITRAVDRDENGKAELLRAIEDAGRAGPTMRRFWMADSLPDVCLLELDYMAEHEIAVRRCRHCNRWFLPTSVVNIYCDRVVEGTEGKTCKELGAQSEYQKRLSEDIAKKLYTLAYNKLQTHVGRNSNNMALGFQFERWKVYAGELMEGVKLGTVTFEAFEKKMSMPSKVTLAEMELTEEEKMMLKEKNKDKK